MSVLVLAPHADDEVLGCGGTLARKLREGDRVTVAVLSNAHYGDPDMFPMAKIEQVRDEAGKAASILGGADLLFYDLPAPKLDMVPTSEIANLLSRILAEVKPATVFIPHRGDAHRDHRAVFDAALVAVRPIPGSTVRTVLAYETLSETEWGAAGFGDAFVPNWYSDISEFLDTKICALRAYQSQLQAFPHPRSIEAVRALAMFRGSSIGREAAEAFSLVRHVR